MKKWLTLLLVFTVVLSIVPFHASAVTDQTLSDEGYYLICDMNGWKIDKEYQLYPFGSFAYHGTMLVGKDIQGDETFQIVYSADGTNVFDDDHIYPEKDRCYNESGEVFQYGAFQWYELYFYPNGTTDGEGDSVDGYLYVTLCEPPVDDAWMNKIDHQIIDHMDKPGDMIGSWMWFTDIDQDEFARRVAEATGYTEEEFEAEKKSMPHTTAEEKAALREFINAYYRTRNSIMDEMYEAHNSAILEELQITDIRFLSTGTNSAIVNIPKSRVYEIAQNPSVTYMYFYRLEAELPEPPEGVTYRYGDDFVRYVSERSTATYVPEIWTYEELYIHEDSSGETDWVLLDALVGNAELWMGFGIVGNRVIMQGPSEIFEFGMGLYDVKNDTFIDLTDMTDLSAYHGLEEAIDRYGRGTLLGDIDGDDEITVVDATMIQRCEARIADYPESDLITCEEYIDENFRPLTYYTDFNRDGGRDVTDATCIQRYLVGASYPKYR